MSDELGGLFDKAHRLLPIFPDVIVHAAASAHIIEKVPPWVAAFLVDDPDEDLAGTPLSAIDSDLARAFETITDDVIDGGGPVTDYCIEFRAPSGEHHALMIFADRLPPDAGERRVMFRLHDVSTTVRKRKELVVVSSFHGILGTSNAMRQVFRKIAIYGPSGAPVVVTGETGSGKELVARALHDVSPRRKRAYVSVNCSAISDELFESELFGHDKGAFTGAARTHKGRFERADGGTLFLDEIGDMPPLSQTKLLRVLETGEVERVGGEHSIKVDVRVVAATNVPLEQAVGMGRFRADLFHRLAVFRIHVPPLRERIDDIPLLVEHFLSLFSARYERPPMRITPDAVKLLQEYSWPGNVRELRNVIERVVVETPGTVIGRNAFTEWAHERFQLVRHQYTAYGPQWQGGWQAHAGPGVAAGPYGPPAAVAALPPVAAGAPAATAPPAGTAPPPVVLDEKVAGGRTDGPVVVEGTPVPGNVGDAMGSTGAFPAQGPQVTAVTGGPVAGVATAGAQVAGPVVQPSMGVAPDVTAGSFIPGGQSRPVKPQFTRELIVDAFRRAGGNITLASRLLNVHKATLYRHMKRLGLSREELERETGADDGAPGGDGGDSGDSVDSHESGGSGRGLED